MRQKILTVSLLTLVSATPISSQAENGKLGDLNFSSNQSVPMFQSYIGGALNELKRLDEMKKQNEGEVSEVMLPIINTAIAELEKDGILNGKNSGVQTHFQLVTLCVLSDLYRDLARFSVAQHDRDLALKQYQQSLLIQEKAQKYVHTQHERNELLSLISANYREISNIYFTQYDTNAALSSYEKSHAIRLKLAAENPHNKQAQRNAAESYDGVADIQIYRINYKDASANYKKSLAIRQKLAAEDANNEEAQHNMSISYDNIGYIQKAQGNYDVALASYEKSFAIREKQVAKHTSSRQAKQDLAMSYDYIGDIQTKQDRRDVALANYEKSLAIQEKLVAEDERDKEAQRGVANSYARIALIRVSDGDLVGALSLLQKSLVIFEKLAAQNSRNQVAQYEMLNSYKIISLIQVAQGNFEGALTQHQKMIAIKEKIAASDKSNHMAQFDVVNSWHRMATLEPRNDLAGLRQQLVWLNHALELEKKVAVAGSVSSIEQDISKWQTKITLLETEAKSELEPKNFAAQKAFAQALFQSAKLPSDDDDASTVRKQKLQQAYDIYKKLAEIEPENLDVQEKVAGMLVWLTLEQNDGNNEEAARNYKQAIGIYEKLAEKSPEMKDVFANLLDTMVILSEIYVDLNKTEDAKKQITQCLAWVEKISTQTKYDKPPRLNKVKETLLVMQKKLGM